MPIAFACPCGREYRVSDEHAGKRIRCRDCSNVIEVPLSEAAEAAPPPSPTRSMAVAAEKPRYKLPTPSDDPPPRPRPRKRRRSSESRGGGISISPGVFVGAAMMLGAVVWFVVALYAGWIFFYPPVMFVLGLIRFVTAILGHEEE
jgi:hypothetical protein